MDLCARACLCACVRARVPAYVRRGRWVKLTNGAR